MNKNTPTICMLIPNTKKNFFLLFMIFPIIITKIIDGIPCAEKINPTTSSFISLFSHSIGKYGTYI